MKLMRWVLTAGLLLTGLSAGPAAAAGEVVIEGESLLPAVQATAAVERQRTCCGIPWSGGAQLWFKGTKAGDFVEVAFRVPTTGRYRLDAVLTKAADYGNVRLAVDGVSAGQPMLGFNQGVVTTAGQYGAMQLAAGEHRLRLTVVSKDARSTGYFAGIDKLTLVPAGAATAVTAEPYELAGETASAGAFTKVYDPREGSTPWYYNDHTLIQDRKTGTWHVFAITHAEPANPLDEKNFGHATAPSPQGPWTKQPFALTADPAAGESHIWAPHAVYHDNLYYLFYAAGTPDHTSYRMHLATSPDLVHWTRSAANPLFTDGFDARDPMVTRVGDRWVMYYTANSGRGGGTHQVAYRTSTDLRSWSPKKVAFDHERAGTSGGPTESPFVFRRGEWWYLTICCDASYTDTRVYRSKDPFSFDQTELAGTITSHAAEVVIETDGTTWVTHAGWDMGGLWLAPLRFTPTVVGRGWKLSTPGQRLDIRTYPAPEIESYAVATADGFRELLDGSLRSTKPYLAVGGWGATDVPGVPGSVAVSPERDRISLRDLRFGNEPVRADWTFSIDGSTVDTQLVWQVDGATTAPVWEVALGIDTRSARIGDDQGLDRDGDVAGMPPWMLASGPDGSFAVAHQWASALGGQNRWYFPAHGYAAWQLLWKSGGQTWPVGTHKGGTWRFAGSTAVEDRPLAESLHRALNG